MGLFVRICSLKGIVLIGFGSMKRGNFMPWYTSWLNSPLISPTIAPLILENKCFSICKFKISFVKNSSSTIFFLDLLTKTSSTMMVCRLSFLNTLGLFLTLAGGSSVIGLEHMDVNIFLSLFRKELLYSFILERGLYHRDLYISKVINNKLPFSEGKYSTKWLLIILWS